MELRKNVSTIDKISLLVRQHYEKGKWFPRLKLAVTVAKHCKYHAMASEPGKKKVCFLRVAPGAVALFIFEFITLIYGGLFFFLTAVLNLLGR